MTSSQKSLWLALLLVGLLLNSRVGAANMAQSPEQLMTEVSQQMIETLRNEREAVRERPQHMFDLVDKILRPHVDLNRMSGWAMGKYWRQATPEQRERFIAAFSVMIVRFYTSALLEDPRQLDDLLERGQELITYKPSRPVEGNTTIVRSEVHLENDKTVDVLFAVHNRDGDWKVYDVTVEGVSMVTNYRSSFTQEIAQVGIDGLIKRLEERNQELLDQVINGKPPAQ
ncbi:MAG: ABC transporter substrate-binding protein [Thiohalomonadaceae bacterium]